MRRTTLQGPKKVHCSHDTSYYHRMQVVSTMLKHVTDGSLEKYEAMFISCGFSEKEEINHEETFSPLARYTTIRYIISLTSVLDLKLH